MSARLILRGGGASPMRVIAEGASPTGATFADLLFDANYRGMRHAMDATISCGPYTLGIATPTVTSIALSKVFSAPPLFFGCTRALTAAGLVQIFNSFFRVPTAPGSFNLVGAGIGTTTSTIFSEHALAGFASVTARAVVFDFPMS